MEPGRNQNSDSFENHPKYINFVYNQLEHELDQKIPPEPIRPGKYVLVGVFFFFAIGIIISIFLLVHGVERQQRATSVSASQNITVTPSP